MSNGNRVTTLRKGKCDNHRESQGCCWQFRRVQIAPEDVTPVGYEEVRLSENRIIRVRLVNHQQQDAIFKSQIQEFITSESDNCSDTSPCHKTHSDTEPSGGASVNNSPSHSASVANKRTKSAGPVRSSHSSHNRIPSDESMRARLGRTHTAASVIIDVANRADSLATVSGNRQDIPLKPKPGQLSDKSPTVFMLHGVGGSSDVWHAQIEYFEQEGYEIVIPDFLGHGFSSAPKESQAYKFNILAQDMLHVFDKYCKRKNIVIGHSYGASFACLLARERADLITHLVLISGGSPTPLAPQPGVFQWPVWCLQCCHPLLKSMFGKQAFQSDKTYIPKEKAFDIPAYVLKYTMNGQCWTEGTFEYHSFIATSTLLLHGEQDQLIGIEDEEEMLMAIPGSKLVIIHDASHMVMIEQPDVVNKVIHNFLRGRDS